ALQGQLAVTDRPRQAELLAVVAPLAEGLDLHGHFQPVALREGGVAHPLGHAGHADLHGEVERRERVAHRLVRRVGHASAPPSPCRGRRSAPGGWSGTSWAATGPPAARRRTAPGPRPWVC